MKFYKIQDDINFPNRWYLDEIDGADNWALCDPDAKIDMEIEFSMEVDSEGVELDFTTTDSYSVPIVSERLKLVLEKFEGVDFFPITFIGKELHGRFFIMHIKNSFECVDENASNFEKFVVDDKTRPDKAGHYKAFAKLLIDSRRSYDADIFRVKKANQYMIVNERIKSSVESILPNSGMIFVPV